MQLIKDFLNTIGFFKNDSVIGLSGLRKKREYVKLTIPENYKKTYIPDTRYNFILA